MFCTLAPTRINAAHGLATRRFGTFAASEFPWGRTVGAEQNGALDAAAEVPTVACSVINPPGSAMAAQQQRFGVIRRMCTPHPSAPPHSTQPTSREILSVVACSAACRLAAALGSTPGV